MNRKEFLKGAGLATMGIAMPGAKAEDAAKPLSNVLFLSAHPDDMCSCLGLALRMRGKFKVHVCDFTHGELGLGPAGLADGSTKAVRTREEERVCAEIGADLHWMDEIDGNAYATPETCRRIADLIKELNPRAVFGHWPVDCHLDHVMAAAALQKAVQLAQFKGEYYFFEESKQSRGFVPTYYVDITEFIEEKRRIIRFWACQNVDDTLVKIEDACSLARGFQMRRRPKWEGTYAEAFAVYGGVGTELGNIFAELER